MLGSMTNVVVSPFPVFLLCLFALWSCAQIGSLLRRRRTPTTEDREDLAVMLTATLTLLALIIGFTFSMAVTRYDHRKQCEQDEANAIGTEYLRADLLPNGDAIRVRQLLRDYVDQRVSFYNNRDSDQLLKIDARTAQLQTEMWRDSQTASTNPTPISALAVSGMNEVFDNQGRAQAAFQNRIPLAAWLLMSAIAMCAHLLVGYLASGLEGARIRFLYLPFIVGIAFFLIADLDSPRRGLIRVSTQELTDLSRTIAR